MSSPHQDESAVSPYNPTVEIAVGTVFTILPVVVVGLRFWARYKRNVQCWIDDWMILAALVLSTATAAVYFIGVVAGNVGQHQPLTPNGRVVYTQSLRTYKKTQYINQIFSGVNLGVIKISVLLFYRRIFSVKPFKITSTTMIIVVAAWTIILNGLLIGQCNPPNLVWTALRKDTSSACINIKAVYEAIAYSDLLLDFIILVLPVPSVLLLRLSWRKKIAVLDVILLTSIVLGSGIARVISYHKTITDWEDDPLAFKYDATFLAAGPLFWNFIENTVAIIGACIPSLAPLWRRSSGSQPTLSTRSSTSHSASRSRSRPGTSLFRHSAMYAYQSHMQEKWLRKGSVSSESHESKLVGDDLGDVPEVPDVPEPEMAKVLGGVERLVGVPTTKIYAPDRGSTASPPPASGIQIKKSFDMNMV